MSKAHFQRFAISIPAPMAAQIEEVCKIEGRNRSEFFREAVRFYMKAGRMQQAPQFVTPTNEDDRKDNPFVFLPSGTLKPMGFTTPYARPSMSYYRSWDVVVVPFPFTDQKTSKVRPAVIEDADIHKRIGTLPTTDRRLVAAQLRQYLAIE